MLIDSSGNVGIGTSSPTENLHISSGFPAIKLDNTDAGGTSWRIASGDTGSGFAGKLQVYNEDTATVAMIIASDGRIDMGPNTGSVAGVSMYPNYSEGTALLYWNRHDTAGPGTALRFDNGGFVKGTITYTSSSTSYNTTSDYRLKENITPVQGAADIVKMMRPCTYNFKSDGSWADGFLAHELQELHPRAVIGEKDAMKDEEYEVTPAVYEDVIIPAVEAVAEVSAVYDDEGVLVSEMVPAVEAQPERTEQHLVSEAVMGTRSVPDYQQVDYSKLTPILTAALQEALNKIDALEARLTALEAV